MKDVLSPQRRMLRALVSVSFLLVAVAASVAMADEIDSTQKDETTPAGDIATDQKFVHALGKELPIYRSAFVAFDSEERIPQERIIAEHLAKMKRLLRRVLRKEVLASDHAVDDLEFRGIRMAQDEYIVTELESQEMRVWLAYVPGAGLIVRVRVSGKRPVTSDPIKDAGRRDLLALMSRVFRTPYESDAEVELNGVTRTILAQTIHTGELRRKGVDHTRLVLERKEDEIEPFDLVHFLITDTSPQYAVFRFWIPDPDAKGWAKRPPLFRSDSE